MENAQAAKAGEKLEAETAAQRAVMGLATGLTNALYEMADAAQSNVKKAVNLFQQIQNSGA